MDNEAFGVLFFVVMIVSTIMINLSQEVDVVICKNGEMTTYINIEIPNNKLSFGECIKDTMTRLAYHDLRESFYKK